ncbi:MAG TPA: PD-(D/E)XK nuclease family protein, partial [Capillimicrobium sp.]
SAAPGRGAAAGAAGGAPAAAAAPPSPAPPVPAPPARPETVSYSALRDYARCGLRFKARRVLRLPELDPPAGVLPVAERVDGGALDARQRGSVVHALLEELDLAAPAEPTAERVAELAAGEGAEAEPPDVAAARRLVAAYVGSPTGSRLARARRVRRERGFAFAVGEAGEDDLPLVTGVIDAIGVEGDGGWLVVDFKTDPLGDGPAPDLEARMAGSDYRVQRLVYALAALRAGAPRVEVAHLFLEAPDRPATVSYTAEDAGRLAEELAGLIGPLVRGEYPLTDAPHAGICATCPARDGLCPYPRELKLRPEPR